LKSRDKQGHSETIGACLQKKASGLQEKSEFIHLLLLEFYAKNASDLQVHWVQRFVMGKD